MKVVKIPGGMYADALPNGTYVSGLIEQPKLIYNGIKYNIPHVPLSNRLSPSGRVAYKSHSPGTAFIWTPASGPLSDGRDSYGSNGHYWQGETLKVMPHSPGEATPSTGYVTDGTLTADAWGPLDGVMVYTSLGDGFSVGQGSEGGVAFRTPQGTKILSVPTEDLLQSDLTVFVNGHAAGDQVSLGYHRENRRDSVCVWLTKQEILALPNFVPGQVVTPPAVTPSPIIVNPNPVPQKMTWSAPQNMVAYFNTRWLELDIPYKLASGPDDPHALRDIASEALFQIAGEWHHTYGHTEIGLYPKSGGTNYKGHGEDIILYKDPEGRVFWKDVVVSISTREAKLNVGGEYEQSGEPDKFVAPPLPSLPHAKPDQPTKPVVTVPVTSPQLTELTKLIEALSDKLEQQDQEVLVLREAFRAAAEAITDLNSRLKAVEKPVAAQEYQIVAVRREDKDQGIEIGTSKDYGHAHKIRVRLEKK